MSKFNSSAFLKFQCSCVAQSTSNTGAIKVFKAQLKEINVCWNMAYHRVFGFIHQESVRTFICCIGRLDFSRLQRVFT